MFNFWSVYMSMPTSSYKKISAIGLGPSHVTSFSLKYPYKDPISKYVTFKSTGGLELQHMNFVGECRGETQFSP